MSLVDAEFRDGDFVVRNGDFVLVNDNAAIIQAVNLNLNTQIGFNQYAPLSGWDWMRWLGAPVGEREIKQIVVEVKLACESVADVISARVRYLGNTSEDEFAFEIEVETIYGTDLVAYTLGRLSNV